MAALKYILRYGPYVLLLLVLLVGLDPELWGRPGGGSSFGGGSSSSSGGGSGDGEILGWIIYLVIEYPQIGLPLLVLFIGYKIYQSRTRPKENIDSARKGSARRHQTASVQRAVDNFKITDEKFSQTLFLDFTQHLYFQVHHWRGKSEYRNLKPFLHDKLFQHEAKLERAGLEVSELVVGAVFITDIQRTERMDSITVRFESSYTENHRGHSNRIQVVDQWIFVRKPGTPSKGPEEMDGLHCPNCGSHLELTPTNACHSCGQVVDPGDQHWMLYSARHLQRQVTKGQQFGNYEAERGTNIPTVIDPELRQRGQEFLQHHGVTDFGNYFAEWRDEVVVPMFKTIYEEWEAREYRRSRALMTDNMFRSHHYWIEAYRKNRLVNRLNDLEVKDVTLAKIELDKFYETFTVRIAASVYDYLESEDGKLIGGSKRQKRTYTEYWTLIRRTGVDNQPSDFSADNCPNCGAPVDMGMTGVCNYCQSKVTSGDFGWVLARITQDEVYYG